MELTSNTIPAWVISVAMIYTGFIWLVSRTTQLRMDSRIFSTTFLLWGGLYALFQFVLLEIEFRGFLTRLMLLMLCLSQSLPLTISYIRSRNRHD